MKLKTLLDSISILQARNISEELEIKDICYDSRKCKNGSIFVAIKGYQTNGHQYINNALENGALLAVVEELQDTDIGQIRVADTRVALADLSACFFGHPSRKLNAIAITATNGKTTTAFMTKAIFDLTGIKAGIIGTVKTAYGTVSIPSILTTPESRDLQYYSSQMLKEGVTDLIMEASSHAGEMKRIRNMDYDIISFNNISREHIDQHGSFENYFNIKSQLIKDAKEGAFVILNFDEEKLRSLENQTKAKVLKYSFKNSDYDFSIDKLDLSTAYPTYDFVVNKDIANTAIKKGRFKIELGLAGYSSVLNSFVAVIISLLRGIDVETIQSALKNFAGVERRFQLIYDKDFMIIDDHYANVRNIEVTMTTLEKMDFNELHMLYAIRGNRGVNLNRESAEESAKWLKKLGVKEIISTASKEAVDWKDEVSKEEMEVFRQVMDKNSIKIHHFDRLDEAIFELLKRVKEGDLILLAGCQGMDKGGRIILEKITEKLDLNERKDILKVLDGRAF